MDDNGCVDSSEEVPYSNKPAPSALHSRVLRIAQDQLNLMMSEICQLRHDNIDFLSKEDLTLMILSKISSGEVSSVHISQRQAENYLSLMSECAEKKQSFVIDNDRHEQGAEDINRNPYADSPY